MKYLIEPGIINNIVIALTLTTSVMTTMFAVFYIFLRDRSKSKYDQLANRAVLSEMRASYESQLAKLNLQMTATEQRWKDVNHLLISSENNQNNSREDILLTNFLRQRGLSKSDLRIEKRLVFVLTPFSEEENETYKIISEVCLKNGFRCIRGDEEFTKGDVLDHIIRLMVKSRIVIANIGTRNPNVFYELGIAQAIGKNTILVSNSINKIPFDVKNMRIIIYNNFKDLENRLLSSLLIQISQDDDR